jgi:hypothetical protein
MPKATYAAGDFLSPKVKGLAVHNAKLLTQAGEDIAKERRGSFSFPPLEVHSYCLFGVKEDASVFPISGAPTASDIAPIIKVSNLRALVAKYKLIGFVLSRVPKRTREYEPIAAPVDGMANPYKGAKGAKGCAGDCKCGKGGK